MILFLPGKNAVILCKGILIPYRFSGKGNQFFFGNNTGCFPAGI